MMDAREPCPQLTTIKGRYLIGLLLVLMFGAPIVWPVSYQTRLTESIVSLATYFLIGLFVWFHLLRHGMTLRSILGERLSRKEVYLFAVIAIPLVGVAIAGLYATYVPLSWLNPALVTTILGAMPNLIVWSTEPKELFSNGLNIIMFVLLGPIVEEILFRGFLLNRWWKKYGAEKAIVLSSIMFALMHVEVIGGIVFGLVLARIYVKTKSLIGPIIVHTANNVIVMVLELTDIFMPGESPKFTLSEFLAYSWMAPLGLLIGIPSLFCFYRYYLANQKRSGIEIPPSGSEITNS